MIRAPGRLWVLLASVGLLAPGQGASPLVSLRLEKVTCQAAVQALARATGTPVELVPWPETDVPGSLKPPLANLNEPAQFNWNNVTLAQALRDVGRRYSLRSTARSGGGFLLSQQPLNRPALQYGSLNQTQVRGMRVQAQAITVSGSYPGQAPGERLLVKLHGQALGGDASMLVGVEDLVARDDRGGILVNESPIPARVEIGYPDEWSASFQLSGLQPGAKRLETLEGVLITSPAARVAHLEFRLPLPAAGARQWVGNHEVALTELRMPAPLLFIHPTERQTAGPLLLTRVTRAELDDFAGPRQQAGAVPLLVGASGKTYAPTSVGRQTRVVDGVPVYDLTLRYPVIDEALSRVRVDRVERRAPRVLGSFRIRNLPLPVGTPVYTRRLFYGALQSAPLTPESLDYERAGGVLVSPVQLRGRPAPSGQLALGLSAEDGTSNTRWYDVEVTAQGSGLLPDLRPGVYRVLRVYRPLRSTPADQGGWWQNDEVVTRIEAGKETRLPPLQLVAALPPPPPLHLPARREELEPVVDRVSHGYSRALELSTPPEPRYDGTLSLEISGVVSGVETSRLLGLGNVLARDDRGVLLTQQYRARLQTTSAGDFQGLKWNQGVSLNPPDPGARSLDWVEGDLLAYSRAELTETDVPLPAARAGLRKRVGALQLEVDTVDELQPEPVAGQPPPPRQFRLRGRVTGPAGTELADAQGKRWQPQLIGRSGTRYTPVRTYDTAGIGLWEFRCRYEVPEPVDRIAFKLAARLDPQPVGSFRLLHVPLPEARPFPTPKGSLQSVRKSHRAVVGEEQFYAFLQEGGADLLLPVRLAGRRNVEGSLSVGMAARVRGGWGPLRWIELELVDGEVLLRDVKPGTYRLIRAYQAPDPYQQPSRGSWRGREVQVVLAAGKRTLAPPLSWMPAP